jgi:hypothetical protein
MARPERASAAALKFNALIWGPRLRYNGGGPRNQGEWSQHQSLWEAVMLVLRSAGASPLVRKVRIAAPLLGLDGRIEISPADASDPQDSLRAQNPLGKIPALILEDGEVLFDSAVIAEYLD